MLELSTDEINLLELIKEVTGIIFTGTTKKELETFIKKYSKDLNEYYDLIADSYSEF